jgi:hypothetical protein
VPEYLIAMKYPDWKMHAFPKDNVQSLLLSLQDRTDNSMPPMRPSVGLKVFLGNPRIFPMSYQLSQQVGFDVLQFVINPNQTKLDWGAVGLQGTSFRRKAQLLLNHVMKTRNWIVPYPLVGIEALLQQGISESKDPYERTWCALQLSMLLSQEKADKRLIKNVLDKARRQNGGQMPVADEDRNLFEIVNKMMKGLS